MECSRNAEIFKLKMIKSVKINIYNIYCMSPKNVMQARKIFHKLKASENMAFEVKKYHSYIVRQYNK